MALFSQAPKVSKGRDKPEGTLKVENNEGSYTIVKNENIKLYETPPTAYRSSSIGSALSRLVKRGISRGKSPVEQVPRPFSADSPLSPLLKTNFLRSKFLDMGLGFVQTLGPGDSLIILKILALGPMTTLNA